MNEESGNEGSSSVPDIVIARLSFDKDDIDKSNDNESNNATEDDAKSTVTITEFNVNEDNNVLIDVISDIKNDNAPEKLENLSMEEKKKGRLKNSFKDRLFKRKKTKSFGSQPSIDEIEPESTNRTVTNKSVDNDDTTGVSLSKSPATISTRLSGLGISGSSVELPDEEENQEEEEVPVKKMMKKKKASLVRRLSLNKFRLSSTEQIPEVRQTPEGDSSRSQSSQESPSHDYQPSYKSKPSSTSSSGTGSISKKGYKFDEKLSSADKQKGRESNKSTSMERRSPSNTWGQQREKGLVTTTSERRTDDPRRRQKPSENLSTDKTVTTVTTLLQRRSPSVTIRTSFVDSDLPPVGQESPGQHQTVSTLPYALSKWPDEKSGQTKKGKFVGKSDSESALKEIRPDESSPVEVKRKLSFLKEKRAIFQRKYFESSEVNHSGENSLDTVIDNSGDSVNLSDPKCSIDNNDNIKIYGLSRHINVRTFDSFSTTFKDSIDEQDTDNNYLYSIDISDNNNKFITSIEDQNNLSMAVSSGDSIDTQRRFSGDSSSTHNNAPSSGVTEKREHLYKILVIGELGAGKTSIIKRYVHQFFSQHYRATIGVDFALKVLNWDPNTIIRLQLWDIAGQERFGNMTRVYYKEAVGAFIVFDVTRSATLDAVVKWKQDLDSKVQLPDGSPIPCVLLANKCDQSKEGLANSPGKMDDYCKEKNFVGWFETSAKENINIEEAARFLVNKILQNDQIMKGNGAQDQVDGERFALNQSPTGSKKSCAC
ncbi:TNF receptor-associated factor family protein DDB_G0272098 isoform X1 [Microplitis mediator]|uniref:TNF receptor-associated factor family protein DDB_G0272098 isoform X1 n=1 Tax=Microplitis mediator TaxID=375433 RepID=UPI00255485FB|nr:TNF receptor-associated factor family protein DDB_G0272098 isoform X1 [Microplitis mediator]